MSQKVSRKSAVNEEKDKRQATSPVKEMKKKMAANAEKEKQAAEKATEKSAEKSEKAPEKTEKPAPKPVEKPAEKTDKQDKNEKPDKSGDKKPAEKKPEKPAEKQAEKKPEPQSEKGKEDSNKEDKNGKPEKQESKKPEASKQKQNGRDRVHNGVSDVTLGTNGTDDVLNGTVSADSEDDDVMLVIDDHDHDELFPELTYDDTSDVECFEPPTPENAPSRSFTRRSQPSHKVLKLKDDTPSTDRKLRSSDSPKPQEGKKKSQDSPKKHEKEGLEKVEEGKTLEEFGKEKSQEERTEVEVVVDVEANEGARKPDTNFSKSRVKVSPYRRSMRQADQTNSSLLANYTGNNTTMEMDITESSSILEDAPLDDSSYLRGLRSIRGRSSYKPLKELSLRHVGANRSTRSNASAGTSAGNTPVPLASEHARPTGTVVGRKRKPDADDSLDADVELGADVAGAGGKRMRVLQRLERLAGPFRRVAAAAALPAANRRNAEIVGINTDLPLSAPVVSAPSFDPEALKPSDPALPAPAAPPLARDHDNKRCAIM